MPEPFSVLPGGHPGPSGGPEQGGPAARRGPAQAGGQGEEAPGPDPQRHQVCWLPHVCCGSQARWAWVLWSGTEVNTVPWDTKTSGARRAAYTTCGTAPAIHSSVLQHWSPLFSQPSLLENPRCPFSSSAGSGACCKKTPAVPLQRFLCSFSCVNHAAHGRPLSCVEHAAHGILLCHQISSCNPTHLKSSV